MRARITAIATYVLSGHVSRKPLRAADAGGSLARALSFAVPAIDEGASTMGVEPIEMALPSKALTADDVSALFLATCSGPYAEHRCAIEMARAIDLHRAASTIGLTGTFRGAVPTLRAAADAVEQGRNEAALVIGADRRRGRVYAANEGPLSSKDLDVCERGCAGSLLRTHEPAFGGKPPATRAVACCREVPSGPMVLSQRAGGRKCTNGTHAPHGQQGSDVLRQHRLIAKSEEEWR